MKKLFLGILITLIHSNNLWALNSGAWSSAVSAYKKGDFSRLGRLHIENGSDVVVSYLDAKASLARNNPSQAILFIKNNPEGYFKNDVIHQLLNYYFDKQNWEDYIIAYNQLPKKEISSNETCGYDIANFAQNEHLPLKSDLSTLINNKMPLWCISLTASKLNDKSLPESYLQPFLLGLISNHQVSQFNQLSGTFKYPKINTSLLSSNIQGINKYQQIYQILQLGEASPDGAYKLLSTIKMDDTLKKYLYSQITTNLAIHQMFDLASKAVSQGGNNWLSDSDLEWRVKTYLVVSKWQEVIDTINVMPQSLASKNVWLYWKAFALSKLGQQNIATQTLKKIPVSFSYYSLLAQSEMRRPTDIEFRAGTNNSGKVNLDQDISLSFDMYKIGKQNNLSLLVNLANQNLRYIASQSNDDAIAEISKTALTLGWTEMSIYAANRLSKPDASLSFPILFANDYKKYSTQGGIDMGLALAVTHQESRFNPNALAFDGGVGLMQLMPNTASYIAKKIGVKNCFKDYKCNIRFGVWFLSHLYNKFGGNLIYTAAGYNAGPGRAHNWQQSFANLDTRIQIELIPFEITRDYVKRILANKLIYDGRLSNTSSVNMMKNLNQINGQNTNFIIDDDTTTGDGSADISS